MARFKSDMFPKRESKKMTNLVSGLFTGMLFAPLLVFDGISKINSSQDVSDKPVSKIAAIILIIIGIALIPLFIPLILFGFELFDFPFIGPFVCFPFLILPLGIWGGIISVAYESFTNKQVEEKQKQNLKMTIYDKLINTINEENSNRVRETYYNIVNSNNKIRKQNTELSNKVDKCERSIKSFRYFPILKNKYINKKEKFLSVIENNESSYKKPIITLDVYNTNETTIQDLNGEVFLKMNYDFTPKQTINFDKISHSEIKKNFFFDVNVNPILSLQFNSLELHFYEDVLLIMTKKDFAIVNIESLSVSKSFMLIHCQSSKYYKSFKKKSVGLVFYERVTLVEIKVLSQKINLLFTNIADSLIVYNLLMKQKNYDE